MYHTPNPNQHLKLHQPTYIRMNQPFLKCCTYVLGGGIFKKSGLRQQNFTIITKYLRLQNLTLTHTVLQIQSIYRSQRMALSTRSSIYFTQNHTLGYFQKYHIFHNTLQVGQYPPSPQILEPLIHSIFCCYLSLSHGNL